MTSAPRLRGWTTKASGSWLVAAGFVVAGLVAIRANVFLNNEGIFTWIFAGLTSESVRDMLFYLHARPSISLMYAPFAALGLEPFLWTHLAVATVTIPLVADLARRFGHERPVVPAAFLALSPLFFAGSASGIQNTDGVVGLLLVIWLFVRRSHAAAGAVATLAVLGRSELAFFMLPIAVYSFRERSHPRFLAGALAVAVPYVVLGALYHGTLFWPLQFPSSPPVDLTVSEAARSRYGGNLDDLVFSLLALTPVLGMVFWTSFRSSPPLERLLGMTAVAYLVAIRVLPLTRLVYVDDSPRYVLPALPFLCLMLGRALDGPKAWRASLVRGAALVVIAIALMPWLRNPARVLVLGSVAACTLAATLPSPRLALATLVAAILAISRPVLPSTHLFLGDQARVLDDCLRWITAQGHSKNPVVITDIHLLAIWRDRHAPEVGADIRHVVTPDMAFQAGLLANPATRQFEKIFGTSRYFYAPWIFPERIASLPGEVLLVMRSDILDRTGMLSHPPFDQAEWLVKNEWIGGRLVRTTRLARHGAPSPSDAAHD